MYVVTQTVFTSSVLFVDATHLKRFSIAVALPIALPERVGGANITVFTRLSSIFKFSELQMRRRSFGGGAL